MRLLRQIRYMIGFLYDNVHTWPVSVHDRYPYMTGFPLWQIPDMTGVPKLQVSVHEVWSVIELNMMLVHDVVSKC